MHSLKHKYVIFTMLRIAAEIFIRFVSKLLRDMGNMIPVLRAINFDIVQLYSSDIVQRYSSDIVQLFDNVH